MKHILVLFIAAASIFSRPLQAQTNASQITINRLLGLTENPTSTNTSDLADAGQNSIVGGHGGTTTLIVGDDETGLNVSNNWWGATGAPASADIPNFNYSGSSTFTLSGPPTPPSFECGSLFDMVGHKGSKLQSLQDTPDSVCLHTLGVAYSLVTDGFYDQAYDSACYYLRHCYAQADPQEAFGGFNESDADTIENQVGRTAVRSFLLSVLPLRSDNDWFCHCVLSLGGSFFEDSNSDREGLSLLYWLINNPRCSAYQSAYIAGYYQERKLDSSNWADTAHYPEKYDSSLLTMQQMGLDSVLIIAATEGVQYQPGASQILLDAHITTNPFSDATNLSLLIGREAYIHIGVYNLLGNQIAGAGYNGTFEQGSAIVPLNLGAVPQGIYYVRIQTANNETQTLKLVKE